MGLKDLYYSIEDKWYSLMDSLQEKGIPVYKVLDPIDKIIPSLIVFSLITLLLITGIGLMLFSGTETDLVEGKESIVLTVQVKDVSGINVSNALIEVEVIDSGKKLSERSDSNGKAEFNLIKGQKINLFVSKTDFFDSQKDFFVFENLTKSITLSEIQKSFPQSFVFLAPNGAKLSGTEITARFYCSNSNVFFENPLHEIIIGEIDLIVPEGCGTILVDVTANGFENKKYSSNGGIIHLSKPEALKGILNVSVLSEIQVPLQGIQVRVLSGNADFGSKYSNELGQTNFELEYGFYRLQVIDPKNKFAGETKSIEVNSANQNVFFELSEEPFAELFLTAKNIDSDEFISAKFQIRKEQEIISITSSEENLEAVFLAMEPGTYYVRALKEEFVSSEEIEVELNQKGMKKEEIIGLSECTPETCSPLIIKVIDEDGLAVENALVNLHDANTSFLRTELTQRTTDFEGYAKPDYALIEEGEFFASALKFPASGESENFEIIKGQRIEVIVPIIVGNTIINVQTADEFGQAIPFVDVELIDSKNEKLGVIKSDNSGFASYELKADKQIYLRITKEEYSVWTSHLIQLFPDTTINLNAVLNKESIIETPEIKFMGLFEKNTQTVIDLPEPARTYDALFELTIPTEKTFDLVGMHLRTGLSERIEKDWIFISKINAPNTAIIKGTTFSEENHGNEQITNSSAKWSNVLWFNPIPGKYLIQAEIKIKPDTPPLTPLPIYFRAWGKTENEFYRNPLDEELGKAENSELKNGLYANVFEKIYFKQEMQEACPDAFCFFTKVLDVKEDYYLREPFKFRISNDYNLSFNLINNTGELHDNANLRIKVTEEPPRTGKLIRIESYEVYSSDKQSYESTSSAFELPRMDLGEWKNEKTVNGVLMLNSREEGKTNLLFEIVSDKEIVFSELIEIENYFEFTQNLKIEPEFIPAFSETILTIEAKYANGTKEGQPIVDALISMERITGTYDKSYTEKRTDKTGKVSFVVPASSPETTIKITSRKPDVLTELKEIKISGQVLEITPESIFAELNNSTKREEKIPLTLKNIIGQNQIIKSIKATGRTKGLLNALQMENYFNQFSGTMIESGKEKEISAILSLGMEANNLFFNESISGELLIETTSSIGFTSWFSKIPFNVEIDVGRSAREENCLVVTPTEWKEAIHENYSVISFEVFNNCVDKAGNSMDLENLQTKINWESNAMGLVELTLINPEEGMEVTEVLPNGRWVSLFSEIYADSYFFGTLKFTALQGNIGETAKFNIEFEAGTPTGDGTYNYLNSNPINAELELIDLQECIKFTPSSETGIIIEAGEEYAEFSIDTSNCAGLAMDFRFCGRQRKCTTAIEGGLFLTPWDLRNVQTSGEEDSEKTVRVQRETIPGTYGIQIEARPQGGSYREITEMLVIVEPKPNKFLEMQRTNFMLIGEGTKDETAVFNRMFTEDVKVKANLCNWKEVQERMSEHEMILTSLGAGIGTAMAAGKIAAMAAEGAKLAAAGGVPGLAVAIVVAVATYAILAHRNRWSNYCTRHYHIGVLEDFVVNLVGGSTNNKHLDPDLISLSIDKENVLIEMNSEVVDEYYDPIKQKNIQQVGFVFTNAGLNEPKPSYGLIEITMREHIHGDETHSGTTEQEYNVFCNNNNFGPRWIGNTFLEGSCDGAYTRIKTEKYHVRFVSDVPQEELPEVSFDEFDCQSSIRVGRTGEEFLPRVRFNWDWFPAPNGIKANSCDFDNPDFIYCDATQFTIALSNKIHSLYEFLKINNFDLGCPQQIDSEAQAINNFNTEFSYHNVESNKAGLAEIKSELSGNTALIKIKVQNNSSTTRIIPVKADFGLSYSSDGMNVDSEVQECEQSVSVSAGSIQEISCYFNAVEDGIYSVTAFPTINEDWTDTFILMHNLRKGEQTFTYPDGESGCWLARTTETYFGRPLILDFIQENNPIWTNEIPNEAALKKLLNFNAYLIQDGYSKGFRKDFVEFYSTESFLNPPVWFNNLEQKAGKTLGLKDLLKDEENFYFTKKYSIGEETLSSPGLYSIELALHFEGTDWSFFDEQGNPNAIIAVIFYKTKDPVPNSPFYYLPLNGFIGLKGDGYSRQGYGVSFINENAEQQINFTEGLIPVKTFSDYGSNPIKFVSSKVTDSLRMLNSSLGSRGNVLSVINRRNLAEINFSPSKATPVLMTVSENRIKNEEVSAFYSLTVNELIEETGSVLTYWTGVGRCLDFSGVPVTESFAFNPDRKASSQDRTKISNWMNSFAVDWPYVDYPGNTFLRTIFYTPQKKQALLIGNSSNVSFSSISGTGSSVSLTGMHDAINSIQKVFELVKSKDLCITSNGSSASFWWNPRKLYMDSGLTYAMQSFNAVDNPGSCIGYPSPTENQSIPDDEDPEINTGTGGGSNGKEPGLTTHTNPNEERYQTR